MRLLLLCLCWLASYAVAEEPVEHRGSGGEQSTRIYGLSSNGLVPASTTLLATPYSFGGGFGLFPGQGQGGQYPGQGGFPGGYPHNNNNNYPGQQQGSSSCRYWCRTPNNQYYCCEGQNQQIGGGGGQVGNKPGFCPPVRPSCPPIRFGPRQCSNDYGCSGQDKCCFDTCLQHHTCKPVQGGYGR